MVTINGIKFYRKPEMCGECAAFTNGSTDMHYTDSPGLCALFDIKKSYYANTPRRCERLIGKAMFFPEGTNLVIVQKTD